MDAVDVTVPPSGTGCVECLATTGGWWYHLRRCARCGHIGCCDSSAGRHAVGHFAETGHSVMRSIEAGDTWGWCYVDEAYLGTVTR